jgi:predicted RecB family nuclease
MAAKITRDVIESHLHCKFKAHLKLASEQGSSCDYERLLATFRDEVRLKAVEKILARHRDGEVSRNVPLTAATLREGPSFVLDATLEDDSLSLAFDGLKKVEGVSSKLGDFHYLPVLFHEGRNVGKEQKLLLELYAFLLSRVQGRVPAIGVVWHGRECRATGVRISPDPRRAAQLLRELKEIATQGTSPKLILNDHCQVCEFRQRCQHQAVREDNLSLLRGMREKEVKAYTRKGILTVTQLSHTFRPRRQNKRQAQKPHRRYHALQALAIREKKVYVFGTAELPERHMRIYLDVESDPDEGYVYLIGMIVAHDGAETRHSFWADSKEQEQEIFEQFLAEVTKYEAISVFSYGSYERTFIKRMREIAKSKEQVDRLLGALENVLSLVYAHVYFPCYSNGLKDVGGYLGCSWSEPDASGIQSVVWRKRWETVKEEGWKQKLLTYNLQDCAALSKVTAFLDALQSRTVSSTIQHGGNIEFPAVASADDLKPHSTRRTWCKAEFFLPEFAEINDCAYFDYQRDKVYLRTSSTLARVSRKRKKRKKARRLRVNGRVELTIDECPHCKSADLARSECKVKRKLLYDLKFSQGGIRRRVVECVAHQYSCAGCHSVLFPEKFSKVVKHQHALKSWVVFEHVGHRVSFEKIGATLEDYFGLHVNTLYLLKFKDLMARHYQATYDGILKRIVSGSLIHADETQMAVKGGEGYVWVFTNLEAVALMYKPTREGSFLHDLLRGFKGVLVSDFFTAYDSLPWPQQKCLIHLMRDFNHDLFQAPYDEELKSVASKFGELLRRVIKTVDKHGLRSKYLSRHTSTVDRFFDKLSDASYTSEVAQGYQARLLKNREKLFTFLYHDGVPWNNNNAEHAVKQFAYYRRTCEGHITAAGLQEYLVLLSIALTCKYKGVSFLKFLLSRELDIDRFCEGSVNRSGPPTVDVYPAGFSFRKFGDRKRYED